MPNQTSVGAREMLRQVLERSPGGGMAESASALLRQIDGAGAPGD